MKKNNQLGWVLAVAGLGVAGFYIFKKQKPTVATEQLSSINTDLLNIKTKSEEAPKTSQEIALEGIKNMTAEELKQLLDIDFSKMDFSTIKLNDLGAITALIGSDYEKGVIYMDNKVANEFPLPYPLDVPNDYGTLAKPTSPDAYSCIKLDVLLRDITLKIDQEQRKVLNKAAGNDQLYVNGLQRRKGSIQYLYDTSSCPSKIEALKLNESAMLVTKGAIVQENLISSKSNTDQQIYIGVGALVGITGLYMILKK